jgi:hypothetical protein
MKISIISLLAFAVAQAASLTVPAHEFASLRILEHPDPSKRALLQNTVRS